MDVSGIMVTYPVSSNFSKISSQPFFQLYNIPSRTMNFLFTSPQQKNETENEKTQMEFKDLLFCTSK